MGGTGSKHGFSDEELVKLALDAGLKVYAGFNAKERRLVFVHGDSFKACPTLFTILPTGVTEGAKEGKKLPPTKEKGLVTYPYVQFLDAASAQPHLHTHCVWKVDENRYALVQLWTINVNDEFRKVFDEPSGDTRQGAENPDPTHFQPEAVENLYTAVAGLFGEQARELQVKYCTKETLNIDRTYVGTCEQFNRFLSNEGVPRSLGIENFVDNDIQVRTLDKKGNTGTQTFSFGTDDGVEQVLYKRNGFTSFMCVKSLTQFAVDCSLNGEIKPLDPQA